MADGDGSGAIDSPGGVYTLIVELPAAVETTVGALGPISFDPGWYAYTGSAHGPGGFARVKRHRELAAGERETRHWHVDYLLGAEHAAIDEVITTAGTDAECEVAKAATGDPVAGMGCSDCDCPSHVAHARDRPSLAASVRRAHAGVADDGP